MNNPVAELVEATDEMSDQISRLTAAVKLLQDTVDHWDVDTTDLPAALKKQAH